MENTDWHKRAHLIEYVIVIIMLMVSLGVFIPKITIGNANTFDNDSYNNFIQIEFKTPFASAGGLGIDYEIIIKNKRSFDIEVDVLIEITRSKYTLGNLLGEQIEYRTDTIFIAANSSQSFKNEIKSNSYNEMVRVSKKEISGRKV